MTKSNEPQDLLSAAECATRTGLTVRALHVYERYGLIVPKRTVKGWRVYGRQDIARLNVITALKAVGLSLVQIRDIVRANPPSLDRILEIQVRTWRARKAETERGLALAETALAQVRAHQALTTEDLCHLIQNVEMDGLRSVIEDVVEDQFSPAERQDLGAWTEKNWLDSEGLAETFIKSRHEASQLIAAGAGPSSKAAQALIARMMKQERDSSIFERARLGVGSILDATKAQDVAKALVKRMGRDPASQNYVAAELFIDTARQIRLENAAGWGRFTKTTGALVATLRRLVATRADPASAEASAVVDRFAKLGRTFSLGDPVFYALWAHEKGPARKDLWEFISQAEQARSAETRH